MKRARPTRRPKRPIKTKARIARKPSRPLSYRNLERVIGQLQRSVRATVTRGDAVLAASVAIGDGATSAYRTTLIRALAEEGILAALDRLSTEPAAAETAAGFREVFLGWLRRQFDLESVYEPGESMSVPRQVLERFGVEGALPDLTPQSLVSIRVIQSGWRVGQRQIVKPQVTIR